MPTSQHSTATVAAFDGRTDDHNPCAALRSVLEDLLDAIDARFTPEGLERYPAKIHPEPGRRTCGSDAVKAFDLLTRDFVTRVELARYLLSETD